MACAIDCGTYNLVFMRRNLETNEVKSRKEVNCFIEISLQNLFTFQMLKSSGVKMVQKNDVAYVVGQKAMDLAYSISSLEIRRCMKDGCLNPGEKDAMLVLKNIIHSLIGEVEKDKEIIYYSVPANAVNEKTNAEYHQKVLESIFKSYNVNGKTLNAYPINEGLSLCFSGLSDKLNTGLAISFGSGMVNMCYSVMSVPVFTMSSVNGGDWIDENCSTATGESKAFINKVKMETDLTKTPTTMIERAIHAHYRILIEKTMMSIKKAISEAGNKVRTDKELDVVVGGGVSIPNGFEDMVRDVMKEINFPLEIGEIRKPKDVLYAVARGCLVAAEMASMN